MNGFIVIVNVLFFPIVEGVLNDVFLSVHLVSVDDKLIHGSGRIGIGHKRILTAQIGVFDDLFRRGGTVRLIGRGRRNPVRTVVAEFQLYGALVAKAAYFVHIHGGERIVFEYFVRQLIIRSFRGNTRQRVAGLRFYSQSQLFGAGGVIGAEGTVKLCRTTANRYVAARYGKRGITGGFIVSLIIQPHEIFAYVHYIAVIPVRTVAAHHHIHIVLHLVDKIIFKRRHINVAHLRRQLVLSLYKREILIYAVLSG